MTSVSEMNQAERVELILHQLHALPTLSPIATRLLQLTADDESDVRDVVQVIESDPALTAKVLSLLRRANRGVSAKVDTVDRAVVMLGFETVRGAVLSLEVYHLFPNEEDHNEERQTSASISSGNRRSRGAEGEGIATGTGGGGGLAPPDTDAGRASSRQMRTRLWMHCLAVATAAELLTEFGGRRLDALRGEAFVCGLLHDLGKLALDRVLPRSFAQAMELADRHITGIAEMERRVIGLDHHTAGKRLAEQWKMPHVLQDVMWLHGQPYETLPDLPHRRMIGLISLADAIARWQHIGCSGNHAGPGDLAALCRNIEIDPAVLDEVVPRLHETIEERSAIIGLNDVPSRSLFLDSIMRANRTLGRINETLDRRSRLAVQQERVLRAISGFHEDVAPGQSLMSVCGQVIASAAREWGQGFFAVLCPVTQSDSWQICQFSPDGRPLRTQIVEPPPGAEDELGTLDDDMQVSVGMLSVLPWLSEFLADASDVRNVRLLPLRCGRGLSAILIHDRNIASLGFTRVQLLALCETWASAISAARQHEGAKRLGEQLAESNRILTETQSKLARTQLLAALGELAAGAAHEMNNPLTVISGRSQVLAMQSTDRRHRKMAEQIVEQAHRLSDLITSLHLFAEPPSPNRVAVNLPEVIGAAVRQARHRKDTSVPINVRLSGRLPTVEIDQDQIGLALFELIVNALEAEGTTNVGVQAQIEPDDDRLVITVTDDGAGMSASTLSHAFDPFFSEKPAGRQPGLGLARAQRLVDAHGGTIEIDSRQKRGTTARILISRWRSTPVDASFGRDGPDRSTDNADRD
ncbi:MAG: HDOD domain-containing protein, partial [Planctomycetota bacterium]